MGQHAVVKSEYEECAKALCHTCCKAHSCIKAFSPNDVSTVRGCDPVHFNLIQPSCLQWSHGYHRWHQQADLDSFSKRKGERVACRQAPWQQSKRCFRITTRVTVCTVLSTCTLVPRLIQVCLFAKERAPSNADVSMQAFIGKLLDVHAEYRPDMDALFLNPAQFPSKTAMYAAYNLPGKTIGSGPRQCRATLVQGNVHQEVQQMVFRCQASQDKQVCPV